MRLPQEALDTLCRIVNSALRNFELTPPIEVIIAGAAGEMAKASISGERSKVIACSEKLEFPLEIYLFDADDQNYKLQVTAAALGARKDNHDAQLVS